MTRKRSAPRTKSKSAPAEAVPQADAELISPGIQEVPPVNPKPQTETMEVHHHPEIERKTFKQYLLEGIMIFIAVLMGFIADNIREGYTEHQKAKAYAATMAADLATDTAALKTYINYYNLARMNVDTLMQLLSSADIKNIPAGKLYLYGLWGGARDFFIPNDATFQQMKSTGALQFFKRSVAREAAEYDQLCRNMQMTDASDEAIYADVRKFRAQIFEFQYNDRANDIWIVAAPSPAYRYSKKKTDLDKISAFIKSNPPLLTYDQSVFNEYVEMVRSRKIEKKVQLANTVLAHATMLLSSIKKEYHIDK